MAESKTKFNIQNFESWVQYRSPLIFKRTIRSKLGGPSPEWPHAICQHPIPCISKFNYFDQYALSKWAAGRTDLTHCNLSLDMLGYYNLTYLFYLIGQTDSTSLIYFDSFHEQKSKGQWNSAFLMIVLNEYRTMNFLSCYVQNFQCIDSKKSCKWWVN